MAVFAGMGHDLPQQLLSRFINLIEEHAGSAPQYPLAQNDDHRTGVALMPGHCELTVVKPILRANQQVMVVAAINLSPCRRI